MPVFRRHDARGIPKHLLATLEGRGGGLPSASEPRVQHLSRARSTAPDGDRRHGSESGGVVDEIAVAGDFEHHVVRVLVLRHHFERTAGR